MEYKNGFEFTHVSPSQIKTFLTCPRKWAYEKVWGVKEEDKPHFAYGTALHHTVEGWLHGNLEVADFRDFLEENERSELWEPDREIPLICMRVQEMINTGWLPDPGSDSILGIERRADNLKLDGIPMLGYIDLIERGPDGVPMVDDHKTTSNWKWTKSATELKFDPQAIMYGRWVTMNLNNPAGSWKDTGIWFRHLYYHKGGASPGVRQSRVHITWDHLCAQWKKLCSVVSEMKVVAASVMNDIKPDHSSCGKFGGCYLIKACSAVPYGSTEGQGTFEALYGHTDQPTKQGEPTMGLKEALAAKKAAKEAAKNNTPEPEVEETPEPEAEVEETEETPDESSELQEAMDALEATKDLPEKLQEAALAAYPAELIEEARVELGWSEEEVDEDEDEDEDEAQAPPVVPPDAPEDEEPVTPDKRPLGDVGVSTRAANVLDAAGIKTPADVKEFLDAGNEFKSITGIGASSVDEIMDVMETIYGSDEEEGNDEEESTSSESSPETTMSSSSEEAEETESSSTEVPDSEPAGQDFERPPGLVLFIDCMPQYGPFRTLNDFASEAMKTVAKQLNGGENKGHYNRVDYSKGPREVASILAGNLGLLEGVNLVVSSTSPLGIHCIEVLEPFAVEVIRAMR